MINEKIIIRVRRGTGELRYCACDNAGNPIMGFKKLSDIRNHWRNEIRWGYVEIVRELDKTADMKPIYSVLEFVDVIMKACENEKNVCLC